MQILLFRFRQQSHEPPLHVVRELQFHQAKGAFPFRVAPGLLEVSLHLGRDFPEARLVNLEPKALRALPSGSDS